VNLFIFDARPDIPPVLNFSVQYRQKGEQAEKGKGAKYPGRGNVTDAVDGGETCAGVAVNEAAGNDADKGAEEKCAQSNVGQARGEIYHEEWEKRYKPQKEEIVEPFPA